MSLALAGAGRNTRGVAGGDVSFRHLVTIIFAVLLVVAIFVVWFTPIPVVMAQIQEQSRIIIGNMMGNSRLTVGVANQSSDYIITTSNQQTLDEDEIRRIVYEAFESGAIKLSIRGKLND